MVRHSHNCLGSWPVLSEFSTRRPSTRRRLDWHSFEERVTSSDETLASTFRLLRTDKVMERRAMMDCTLRRPSLDNAGESSLHLCGNSCQTAVIPWQLHQFIAGVAGTIGQAKGSEARFVLGCRPRPRPCPSSSEMLDIQDRLRGL